MISLENILAFAYLALILVGIIFSFVWRDRESRIMIRLITAAAATPLLVIITMFALAWLFVFRNEAQPPTIAELTRDFPAKRADLETILRMSDEDLAFRRIAPDFLTSASNATLPKNRWDDYKKLYRRTGINLGIERDPAHDAFIMVESIGILNRGRVSGYVYCSSDTSADGLRYVPCRLPQDNREAPTFQRITGRWYAYNKRASRDF